MNTHDVTQVDNQSSHHNVSLSRRAAHALETGRLDGSFARVIAVAWDKIVAKRSIVRPSLDDVLPAHIPLVCIGGATLGGSGKTRVAIACATHLAKAHPHKRVVLVGHAYRASSGSRFLGRAVIAFPPHAHTNDDDVSAALEEVGDEAIICARALALHSNAHVVVGPTRRSAIDFAVTHLHADAIVLDGPLAIAQRSAAQERRRSVSILSVDAMEPWGTTGQLPPAGDLRASRRDLLAVADHVLEVNATPNAETIDDLHQIAQRKMRIGLFTAMARPSRLVRAIAREGIRLHEVVSLPDHGIRGANDQARAVAFMNRDVDIWIATEKCALHMPRSHKKPVRILRSIVTLSKPIERALDHLHDPM